MAVKVGINGFGRIGRLAARILGNEHPELELVAVNSRADNFQLSHLLQYDSVHRCYNGKIGYDDEGIIINGKHVLITRYKSPDEIPWSDLGVEMVLECTGVFKKQKTAKGHLASGAKKVLISAPSKDETPMFVMGVNHGDYDPATMDIISNASCTTNCLAPLAKVLHESFDMEYGLMTTIHSYTMSQRILDGSANDIRRARAAAMSMIPTSTGAARSLGRVIPQLAGLLDGFSIRVPTPNVSVVDLSCRTGRDVTVQEVNQAFTDASTGDMFGIILVSEVPLVSIDYTSSPYSAIVDADLTMVMNKRLVKVLAWYDNEMGFAQRLIDLAAHVARQM